MVGLGKWLRRAEWQDPMVEVFAEHVASACADEGIEVEKLEEIVGREAFIDAWGAACEDFCTRELDDGRNIADDYLKRRGWKESPANREFIAGLRRSVQSLYEVTDVAPGQHFTVVDLIRGGDPVQVDEPDRSRYVDPGDLLGMRLIRVRKRLRTGEFILPFSPMAASDVQRSLQELLSEAKTKSVAIAAELGRPDEAAWVEEQTTLEVVLAGAAPIFTDRWLRGVLDNRFDRSPPRMINSDGDEVEFATAVYGLAPGIGDADLARVLRDLPWVEDAPPPEKPPVQLEVDNPYDGWTVTWHWVDHEAEPDPDSDEEEEEFCEDGSMRLNPRSRHGLPVLGDISRRGDTLRLATNTRSRLERGRALLEPALGELVDPPEVAVRSMVEFLTEIMALTRGERR